MKKDLLDAYISLVRRFNLYPERSETSLRRRLNYMFKDVSFEGKLVLDIGAGSGLFSLFSACMGAESVVSLEPELAGGSKGSLSMLTRLSEYLPENTIVPLPLTFQDYDPGNKKFDIILMIASINHLDEEACINLQNSGNAVTKYQSIFQKLGRIVSPGAKLIICDCSRYNFFRLVGIPNPLSPTIEWEKHQSPRFWAGMLKQHGFGDPAIRWESPSTRYRMARWFLRNSVGAYLTSSSFCMVMKKLDEPPAE